MLFSACVIRWNTAKSAHSSPRAVVRVTHWLTAIAFFALLITGGEIVISHPRFYWGEVGNSTMQPLFSLHIPASRGTVQTGYNYVMPDQNGWSRYLHFQAAGVPQVSILRPGIVVQSIGLLRMYAGAPSFASFLRRMGEESLTLTNT